MNPELLHATTIALLRPQGWRGVLLRGRSGAGKSTLALRALEGGWRLVADDRTLAWSSGGALYGRAPETILGLIEARGLGILPARPLPWAQVVLVVDVTADEVPERMPEAAAAELCDISAPLVSVWAHDSAAVVKLTLALDAALACAATSLGLPR